MPKMLTKEKFMEIKQIAEEKLEAIRDRIDKEEYDFFLRETIKEIASDMGYAISDYVFEDETS